MVTRNDLKRTLKSYHEKNYNDIKTNYSVKNHNHTVSEISNLPTSLPANGGNADTVDGKHASDFIASTASCNKNWNWSGKTGQPTWLWGGNDITNMYVYNPSNFNVNYATTSGTATNSNALGGVSLATLRSEMKTAASSGGGDYVGKTMQQITFNFGNGSVNNKTNTYTNSKGGFARLNFIPDYNPTFTIVVDGVTVSTGRGIFDSGFIVARSTETWIGELIIPFNSTFSISTTDYYGACKFVGFAYLNK